MIVESFESSICGSHSPSSLTTHAFTLRGHEIDLCERSIGGTIKKDLFGFADHVATYGLLGDGGVIKFLQSTSESNRLARIKKISVNGIAKLLCKKGHDVAVVSWKKKRVYHVRKNGTRSRRFRYTYTGRISTFEEEDFKC